MTREDLISQLSDIEWEDFEVKQARSEIPKNVWETVSAFSNTAGGWLVFGVKKNGKQYEIVGVKKPEKIEQDFTKATFYFKKKEKDREKLGYKLGNKLGYKLGKRQQQIFEAILDNQHITIVELAKQLKIATTTVEYNINKLKEKGLLERIGSRKEGQWKVSL